MTLKSLAMAMSSLTTMDGLELAVASRKA